ncbi:MAG TPA: G1 family glutamic endopeptidase, partial [Acidimicrobiales bacterium]
SGYAATGGTFSSVSGSWTVPTATCTQATTYSSVWIGIDGYSSNTVQQDGTEADCSGGVAAYSAWYEMYGDASVNKGYSVALSSTSYPVSPGDAMTASVSFASSQWTLTLDDTTAGWNFSVTVASPSPPAAQSSAEWIVERPEVCSRSCSLATLTTLSPVTFTNARATSGTATGPISQFAYSQMEMVSQTGTTVLALPSSLGADGLSFSVTEP